MSMFSDEVAYAKTLVNKKFKDDGTCFKKCVILGRYMLFLGKSEQEIYNVVKEKYDVMRRIFGNIVVDDDIKHIMITIKAQGPLKPSVVITFSDEELQFIRSCGNLTQQKALFIICCLWKSNGMKEFTMKQKPFFDEIKTSRGGNNFDKLMYYLVGQHHYVESRVYKMSLLYQPCEKLRDMHGKGKQVLSIDNFKNIVYYYLEYFGEGQYIRCVDCGAIDKKTANAKKLCDECAKERKRNSSNESKKRIKSERKKNEIAQNA